MIRSLRFLIGIIGGIWSLVLVLITVGSLALSVAMTLVPAVFAAVSGVVETVSGAKTLYRKQLARQAALTDDLARAERRAALGAEQRVTYRGAKVTARQAVTDTTARVSRRVERAALRNVGSVAGEALPVIGVGVVVAATAWELSDACAMMGEMRALDAAFNPETPISEDAVCGMTPPTKAEIWSSIKASPGAVWDATQSLYTGLPDLSLGGAYAGATGMFGTFYDWAFEKDEK